MPKRRATIRYTGWTPTQAERVLADRAEVVEYRADGFFKVVSDPREPAYADTWWLRPQQMNGGQVGDIGKVTYVVTPTSGLAYFTKATKAGAP